MSIGTPSPEGAEPTGPVPPLDGPQPDSDRPTVRSDRAPSAAEDPFRPTDDPELAGPPPAPTSPAYGRDQHAGLPGEHGTEQAMVIGEALIDIVEAPGQEPREHPGGSPANVAVGLARLGRPVELVTWFAPDDRGATLRAHLEAENVSVSAASARAPRTSTARARLDETGAATYVFDLEWAPPAPEAGAPVHVHTGSIAAVLEPGDRTVLATVSRHRGTATISYDPNVRPDLMGTTAQTRPRVEALVNLADIIKASDEDLAWLYPELDPAQVARQWAGRGPALVVLTRGDAGSVAFTAAGAEVTVEATPVDVVDTVGAGDSYMAGILDGLWAQGLLGAGHREALRAVDPEVLTGVLRHASRVAGITVSRAGANPPTRAELTAARV